MPRDHWRRGLGRTCRRDPPAKGPDEAALTAGLKRELLAGGTSPLSTVVSMAIGLGAMSSSDVLVWRILVSCWAPSDPTIRRAIDLVGHCHAGADRTRLRARAGIQPLWRRCTQV